MTTGGSAGSSSRVLSVGRRNPVEDPEMRQMLKRTVALVVATLVVAGLFVWLVSLPFDDPPAIRKVVAAIVIGVGGAFLAFYVLREMSEDLEVSRKPPDDHVQPEPVLVLPGVDLRDAALPEVELGRSELRDALLVGANLNAAALQASRLTGADMRDADLRRADLRFADLLDSDLRGADLRATDLRGARLADAQFDGAIYNEATNWPEGEPPPGAIHVKESAG
jgi:Pentapeptide repeats (8 copies)